MFFSKEGAVIEKDFLMWFGPVTGDGSEALASFVGAS
jgi:hypothetical protein